MAELDAELTLVPSEGGRSTRKLILHMIDAARRLSLEPRTYFTNQPRNRDGIAGYAPLAEEIWSQTGGEVDAFVHSVGVAASLRSVATILSRHKPAIRIMAVEPTQLSILLGGPPRTAQNRGSRNWLHSSALGPGAGRRNPSGQDRRRQGHGSPSRARGSPLRRDVLRSQRPRRDPGGREAGSGGKLGTLMADSGLKYLSTNVYRSV